MFFLFNPPWGWNVLEAERSLRSAHHIGWRNTKIYIHESSRMEQKCGKCWKLPIFEGKLQVFISYLTKMKIVYSITLLYSSTFYSLLYHFLFLRYLNSSMAWFLWDDLRMGLLFKFGQAVRDICNLVFRKRGFLWIRVEGKCHTWSGTKNRIFDGFFVVLWWFFNFVKNHPFFKNKGLFYVKFCQYLQEIFFIPQKSSV